MSKSNHVRLIGRLGKDPQMITTESGNTVLTVPMATNDPTKDDNKNNVDRTEWHNIVAFGNLAGIITKHLKKGSRLMVLGRIQNRSYENKQGETRYTSEVVAEEILFLDQKSDS